MQATGWQQRSLLEMGEAEAKALALQLRATWLLTGHRSASLCDGFRHSSKLAESLDLLTTRQPLLLVLEELHWSDYSSLDLLAVLARRWESSRLLLCWARIVFPTRCSEAISSPMSTGQRGQHGVGKIKGKLNTVRLKSPYQSFA